MMMHHFCMIYHCNMSYACSVSIVWLKKLLFSCSCNMNTFNSINSHSLDSLYISFLSSTPKCVRRVKNKTYSLVENSFVQQLNCITISTTMEWLTIVVVS